MQKINSFLELRYAIQVLEVEQAEKAVLLKEQFYITYESLKPVNLIRNTLKEVFLSPNLIDNFVGTTVGMASGYLSKKIVVGASSNIIKKLFGSLLEYGVTNLVAQHPEGIKTMGQMIFKRIFGKKEVPSEES
jgi:hypothetical protein